MSVEVLTHVFKHSRASGNDRVVLLVLADHANDDGESSYPSQETIARKANVTERTVRACLGRLQGMGEVTRQGTHPSAKTVIYDLNLSLTLETSSPRKKLPPRKNLPTNVSSSVSSSSSTSSSSNNNDAREVKALFAHWRQATGRNGRTKLTPGRRRALQARLREGYTANEIRQAITNVAASAFHQGKNDSRRPFNDLTLICRNGEQLEGYRDMAAPKASRKLGRLMESA